MRCNKYYFSLLAVAAFALPAAANDPNLKVYSGPFNIKGFQRRDITGTAEYTYKEAPDGTRIFQGEFKFTAAPDQVNRILEWRHHLSRQERDELIENGVSLTAQGCFNNDYQVGEWIWSGPWPIGIDNCYKDQIIKYTFSPEGKMEGPATFIGENGDSYTFSIENNEPRGKFNFKTDDKYSTLEATWQNGHLVGEYIFIKKNRHASPSYRFGRITKGKYNDEGQPIGKWTSEGFDGTISYAIFSDPGICLESYYIDDMTGDKIRTDFRVDPVHFNPAIYNARENFLMRSSKKKFGR